MPGASSQHSESPLRIIIIINGLEFTDESLFYMTFNNFINEKPSGEFVYGENNADNSKHSNTTMKTGDFGVLLFSNTKDGKEEKFSSIDFIVDNITQEDKQSANVKYRVTWSAGNKNQIIKKTHAFSGVSVDALNEVFTQSNASVISYPSDATKPTDAMVWRNIQETMWERLDTIVKNSFLRNDYIFWAWDDVNNAFKISSLKSEQKADDKYIVIESADAVASTEVGKVFIDKPKLVMWQMDKFNKLSNMGAYRDKLFPNVSFSGVVGKELLDVGFKQTTFSDMLREMGDDKQDEVLSFTGMDEKKDVFGELQIKRHWPNNVHAMYNFSDVYREYKMATYSKMITPRIYNNVGPPLGSKVILVKATDGYKAANPTLDEVYSDEYIVKGKMMVFDPINHLSPRGESNVNNEITVDLILASDNFAGDGTEVIQRVTDKITK